MTEPLSDVRVRLAPPDRVLWPGLLALALVGVLIAGLIGLWPWLRPVHLTADGHAELFRTPLAVQHTEWTEPEQLSPDSFLVRFCRGAISAMQPVDGAEVLGAQRARGRGDTVGMAFSAAYGDPDTAEAAYRGVVDGLSGCTMRSRGRISEWQATGSFVDDGVSGESFGLSGITSRGNFYRSVVVLHYANTVTVFLAVGPQDLAGTATAYRDRVAGISRTQ